MEKGWSREGGMAPNGWLLACLLDSVGEGDGGWPVVLSSLNLSLSLSLSCASKRLNLVGFVTDKGWDRPGRDVMCWPLAQQPSR